MALSMSNQSDSQRTTLEPEIDLDAGIDPDTYDNDCLGGSIDDLPTPTKRTRKATEDDVKHHTR